MHFNKIGFLWLISFAAPTVGHVALARADICRDAKKGEQLECSRPGNSGGCDASSGKIALVFGNDAYVSPIPKLDNGAADARSVAEALHADFGFSVRCVLNANKTTANAQIAIAAGEVAKIPSEVGRYRRFVLYFSGHGYQKSLDAGVNLVFSNTPGQSQQHAALNLALVIDMIGQQGKIAPIAIVDACRSTDGSTGPVGPQPMGSDGAFIGYSVPSNRAASDKEDRFTPFLAKALKRRGQSFVMMWDLARNAYNTDRGNDDKNRGPQTYGEVPAARSQRFQNTADECERHFFDAWTILWPSYQPGLVPVDSGQTVRPSVLACALWKYAISPHPPSQQAPAASCPALPCGASFKCTFERFFEKCTPDDGTQIVSVASSGTLRLEGPRIQAAVEAGQRRFAGHLQSFPRVVSDEVAAFRLPQMRQIVAPEVVIANEATSLRRVPRESETEDDKKKDPTPIPAGGRLDVDCETLSCGPDWLGVRYAPPNENDVWRGFVRRSEAELAAPELTANLAFEPGTTVLTKGSLARIGPLVKRATLLAKARVRISTHYMVTDTDPASESSKSMALLRLSAVDVALRQRGSENAFEGAVKYELLESQVPYTGEATVEVTEAP